jgi:hypothetical protein
MTVVTPGDMVSPQHFGHHYGIENGGDGMDSMQGRLQTQHVLKDYLERMSGENVEVSIHRGEGPAMVRWSERRFEDGSWQISVGENNLTTADVMRMASTMLFTISKGVIEAVTKRMADTRVYQIASTIERARTEWLGDMWFNSTMFDETRVSELSMGINQHMSKQPDDLRGAVRKTIYDVPGVISDPIINAAMNRFNAEIKAAVRSLDRAATLNLAVDIADYMKWRENGGKQGDQPGDSPIPPSEGEGEGDGGDGNGDGEPEGVGNSSNSNDGDGRSRVTPQGGGGSGRLSQQPQQPQREPDESDFESDTSDNRKRIKRNIKSNITRRKNKAAATGKSPAKKRMERMKARVHGVYMPPGIPTIQRGRNTGEFDGEHDVHVLDIGGEPIDLDEYTKLTLGTYLGNRPPAGQLRKRGRVSPMHAWKLAVKGDTRIFQRPPLMQGHVSVLVDISGSMGCWCNDCVNKYPDDLSAYLAWQVTGLLGQLHPTAEVFAYSGGSRARAKIIPLGAGEQPAGCARRDSLSGGTPTCTAMLYFKDHLKSRPSGTTAIIVTDGGPDACYGYGMNHVDYIGNEMLSAGIKFGTVFIGQGRYLNLPAEVSVNVQTLADITRVQPLLEILDR